VQPNPLVETLTPYTPGRPLASIDLYLDANEAVATPGGLETVLAGVADDLFRYPSAAELEARLVGRLGLDPGAVLVTAGADDALERAVRSVCAPGRRAILTRPSFEMLVRYVRLAGTDVTELEWWQGDWPVDRALEIADDRTSLVVVVSPNNPTGAVISQDSLVRLAESLPQAMVLLDHAYAEFAEEDLTATALGLPNVLVTRTFSKARGCAGLRVGWVAGRPEVVSWLRCVGQPYAVSRPSLAAASWLLDHAPEAEEKHLSCIRDERDRLSALLRGFGIDALPSQGNFLLARFPQALVVRDGLAALGIAVRAFSGREGLEDCLRLTLPGDEAAYRRLCDGLAVVLAPEALLFDLDGVFADVSRSYRHATIRTAAEFGVVLSAEEISQVKAAGNANNDWELTRRMLAARDVVVDLIEVTEVFENLYQGTGDVAGLREREQSLITPADLAAIAADRPVAVVTGRPRADAVFFLERFGLMPFVSVLVAMEDAPAKPSPAPVRSALDQLGVERAWMIGDTPDDLRAARGAGVLPIGVCGPGEPPEQSSQTLLAAGAWRVLDKLEQLQELLP